MLRVHLLDSDNVAYRAESFPTRQVEPGTYVLDDTVRIGAWRAGFALNAYDKLNGAPNRNGIYRLSMQSDDSLEFAFALDEVSFAQSRYINAHIDYPASANNLGRMHRLYRLPGNRLPFYDESGTKGIVKLYSDKPVKIHVSVHDFNGNESTLTFYALRDTNMIGPPSTPSRSATNTKGILIKEASAQCSISEGSVYERTEIPYSRRDTTGFYSAIHSFGLEQQPLHKYMSIAITPDNLPTTLRSKAYIGLLEDEEILNCGGVFKNGVIETEVRQFGDFLVAIDTVAPVVTAVQFQANMRGAPRMRFRITDETPITARGRGLRYEASIDGKWILMEYDAKNDMLTHWFDDELQSGTHQLVLQVTDDRNNAAVYRAEFER